MTRKHASLFLMLNLVTSCLAQDLFFWFFANSSVTSTLTQCEPYIIKLDNNTNFPNTFGVPPYYMIAFPAGGIPTSSWIGTDTSNLSWTVNQPRGSSLMLFLMDSTGNPGGIPQTVYSVADGSSECLPPSPNVNISMSANVSGTLETCEPVEFQINGGTKPYSISIVQANANVIHNNTLGSQSGNFTFTNQVDTDSQIIVAVSDANGVWGTASRLFNAVASNKFTCTSLVSSSPPQTFPAPSASKSNPASSNRTAIIAAVVVSVSVVLIFLVVILFCKRWWQRRAQAARQSGPAVVPESWYSAVLPVEQGQSITEVLSLPTPTPVCDAKSLSLSPHPSQFRLPFPPAWASGASPSGAVSYVSAGTGTGPDSSSSLFKSNDDISLSEDKRQLPPSVSPRWIIENDSTVVIQHQDSETDITLQEVPPPYHFAARKKTSI